MRSSRKVSHPYPLPLSGSFCSFIYLFIIQKAKFHISKHFKIKMMSLFVSNKIVTNGSSYQAGLQKVAAILEKLHEQTWKSQGIKTRP